MERELLSRDCLRRWLPLTLELRCEADEILSGILQKIEEAEVISTKQVLSELPGIVGKCTEACCERPRRLAGARTPEISDAPPGPQQDFRRAYCRRQQRPKGNAKLDEHPMELQRRCSPPAADFSG